MKDTSLSLIGCGAYFAQNIIRGVVLTPEGFYVSLLAGALGSVASVGIRAHFSKIVEQQELGKVFSLMSAIDSVAPMVSSILFTNLFNATMDSMPGFSFIIVAGLLVIPFFVIFWIDLYTVLPDFSKTKTKDIEEEVYSQAISDVTKM